MELQEESLTNMFLLFQEYADNKETEKQLWKQVNVLEEQLENSRATDLEICNDLKCLYKDEHFNIATKYVALQERYKELCKKVSALELELKNYKVSSESNIKNLVFQFQNKIKLKEERGKMDVEEIEKQVDKGRIDHNRKVHQLYNELDLAQAATALQQDEVETELCKEFVDINVKTRQMQKINADVRSEIDNWKTRQQRMLQERLNPRTSLYNIGKDKCYTDQTNPIFQTNYNEEISKCSEDVHRVYEQTNTEIINIPKRTHSITNNVKATKYQPIPGYNIKPSYGNSNKNNTIDFTKCNNGTVKSRRANKNVNEFETSKNVSVKDVSRNAAKKRRLFNPDNLDYLDNIEMSIIEK